MAGDDLKGCFEFSIEQCVESIKAQKQAAGRDKMVVWLVGGFAASPWLFTQLRDRLAADGITVFRPDSNTSKAVAEGAISYYLDHWVTARIARFSTGVVYYELYDEDSAEHKAALTKGAELSTRTNKKTYIQWRFKCFIPQGKTVQETETVTETYWNQFSSREAVQINQGIYIYRGKQPTPGWWNPDSFERLCTITVGAASGELAPRLATDPDTKAQYWQVEYDVEFKFGMAEYETRLKWEENGESKSSEASMIYDA